MEMIRLDSETQYIDPKASGEKLESILDPLPAMLVVLSGERIDATQKTASDTAIDAVENGDFQGIEHIGTCHASHGGLLACANGV
jgi:hypothetical protein